MSFDKKIWEDIGDLLDKQEANQNQALEAIERDSDCRKHLKILHGVLRLILTVVTGEKNQEGDKFVLAELGNRIYNDCMASYALTLRGCYHVATMPLRDLLECGYLLHLFAHEPEKIAIWKKVNTREWKELTKRGGELEKLKDQFKVDKLRSRYKKFLGEKNIKIELREQVDNMYRYFCELGVHPTFRGHYCMFRDRNTAKLMWGPYYDLEKVKIFLILLGNCGFFALTHFLAAFVREIVNTKVYSSWDSFKNSVWKPWVKKYGRIANKEVLEMLRNLPIE